MKFSILTLFPEFFQTPLSTSLIGKAKENGIFSVELIQIRDFGIGKYKAVDDRPFGGGAGMLIMAEVLESALKTVFPDDKDLTQLEKSVFDFKNNQTLNNENPFVVMLSPQGIVWNASKARAFSKFSHLVLICGHYEGVDERFIETFVHQEVSIGDYVISGGEAAAYILIDSILRFTPDVLGDPLSADSDTFENTSESVMGGLKAPQYTRPQVWRNKKVPEVLFSGHHEEIKKWRVNKSIERTQLRRPDLMKGLKKT